MPSLRYRVPNNSSSAPGSPNSMSSSRTIRHDVKAVEYYLKERLRDTSLADIRESELPLPQCPTKSTPSTLKTPKRIWVSNALLCHLAVKLPVSRLQRDLSDTSALRNIGIRPRAFCRRHSVHTQRSGRRRGRHPRASKRSGGGMGDPGRSSTDPDAQSRARNPV